MTGPRDLCLAWIDRFLASDDWARALADMGAIKGATARVAVGALRSQVEAATDEQVMTVADVVAGAVEHVRRAA